MTKTNSKHTLRNFIKTLVALISNIKMYFSHLTVYKHSLNFYANFKSNMLNSWHNGVTNVKVYLQISDCMCDQNS